MKTFTRMIGRYVLATAAVVLLVVGLLLGAVVYLGLHYGEAADSRVRIGTLAEALIPTADGLQLDPARTPADWLQGYAWAMVLDDDGSVIWQHDLPQNLNKHYTASQRRKSPRSRGGILTTGRCSAGRQTTACLWPPCRAVRSGGAIFTTMRSL